MDVAPTASLDDSVVPHADYHHSAPLGRFVPPIEADYQRWAVAEAFPVVRVIGWISVLIWVAAPWFVPVLLRQDVPARAVLVCWGVNATALVIGLVVAEHRPRFWIAAALLTLLTLDSMLLITWMDVQDTPLVIVAMTLFYLYLAPVMRFPFRTTAVVAAITVPVTVGWALATVDDATSDEALNFQLWLLGAAVVFALTMTLVTENNARRRYAGERLLARQQALLTESRALIRRYAPAAVADRLEHGDNTVDAAQRRRVTIFFADVVGFTTMADRIDPEALAEIMNDYLGSVADLVERNGGTLNEFAGDGVMALFGAPEELDPADQVTSALAAARALQAALPEWSRRWYPLGIDHDLQARIGINTGVVSVGTFGSAVRATYTGIGLQTNIAARVQSRCPPGSVLLSNTSWHLVKDDVRCEARGEVEVKGVHFPIGMYEPWNHV
ncbi:MAG: adenylate/guanylate cyclase domain-containing protein [Nocardioidaceae bacterium]|nr:adenylate/guanylate cyclase domain-containing protein [Nocardioidaceae bacterium]